MDPNRLFDESGLLPTSTVGFKAEIEEAYPFYLPNFFLRNIGSREDFEEHLRIFFTEYLIAWNGYIKTKKNGIENEFNFLRRLSMLSHDISKHNVFSEVVLAKKRATYAVIANSSVFNIWKIGTCLGIGLKGEHHGGSAAIEMLRADSLYSSCPQIFLKSISSWIPLLSRSEKDGNVVDFSQLVDQLNASFPEIHWNCKEVDVICNVIEAYKISGREEFCIGDYCGVKIYARITHGETLDKSDIRSADYYANDVRIWREGNVQSLQRLQLFEYKFKDASELALVLSVKSSLPSLGISNPIDDEFDNHQEQSDMRKVAAMINVQLRCMTMRLFMISQQHQ